MRSIVASISIAVLVVAVLWGVVSLHLLFWDACRTAHSWIYCFVAVR